MVCGGIIPARDHEALKAAGVAAIFGQGTSIPTAAREIVELFRMARSAAA